jgi:hypothetical protein
MFHNFTKPRIARSYGLPMTRAKEIRISLEESPDLDIQDDTRPPKHWDWDEENEPWPKDERDI